MAENNTREMLTESECRNTEVVIAKYLDTLTEASRSRICAKLMRDEIFDYEKKLGKQIFDMSPEELAPLVIDVAKPINGKNKEMITSATLASTRTHMSNVFDFYIKHGKVIENPFRNEALNNESLAQMADSQVKRLTLKEFNAAIALLYEKNWKERAEYIECILLMYFCGFATASEILSFKEEHIDFNEKTVKFPGKVIHLSDRCFDLLVKIHNTDIIQVEIGRDNVKTYVLSSYDGSYFKMMGYGEKARTCDKRDIRDAQTMINRYVRECAEDAGCTMNYHMIYNLGFYYHTVKAWGKEEANRVIMSKQIRADIEKLKKLAANYGAAYANYSVFRRKLSKYVVE